MLGSGKQSSFALSLLAASFLTPIEVARAEPGEALGKQFRVNKTTSDDQSLSAIAIDDAGNFVVAWTDFSGADGSGYGVFARRYNAAGRALGGELLVNGETNSSQGFPAVAMDAAGNFLVAWRSPDGSGFGIFAQRFDASGVRQGPEFLVNSTTEGNQLSLAAAMDADGDFVVAWDSYGDQDGDGSGVFAQRFSASGVPQGGEFQVNSTTLGGQRYPAVAMDEDGDFAIVWQGDIAGATSMTIVAQRYDASGGQQGGEFRVTNFEPRLAIRPSISMARNGSFVVAYENGSEVFTHRYDADGASRGEMQANGFTTGAQRFASVAMDADGDFTVAWSSREQFTVGYDYETVARRFNAAGEPQGDDFQVNVKSTGNQLFPLVAMDADGDFVVAWADQSGLDGDSEGVFARRFQGDGLVQGDFTVDGRSDILWRKTTNGSTSLWEMNGYKKEDVDSIGSPGTAWEIEGLADFNADTKTDVLWRNTGNGKAAIWLMDGYEQLDSGPIGGAGSNWKVVGTGDFDGDDHADILWRNTASGEALVWKMDGLVKVTTVTIGQPSLDWQVAGVGDFDADDTADILWRHKTNGKALAWKMEDLTREDWALIGEASLDWKVEGLADFDADAKADILWRNMDTGRTVAWEMNGLVREGVRKIGTPDRVWRIDGLGDTNGDRQSDIFWRHTTNAKAVVWQMNGFDRQAVRPIGKPPLVWEMQ